MLGVNVFAAPSDAEARLLLTSLQQAFVNLRRGVPVPLPPPEEGFESRLSGMERAGLAEALSCSFIGSCETVRRGLEAFIARTAADEIIVASMIFDHAARLRSYELTAQVHEELSVSD
jgi:alkanesulfonate monooxygenase SsuD/methylene tetrahydromethanopterin reductase-like flavin-dependent oxidoreductase (luciferase family)